MEESQEENLEETLWRVLREVAQCSQQVEEAVALQVTRAADS